MAWHEWPLILFTVLAQTAVGAFLLLGCIILSQKLSVTEHVKLHRNMFFIWVLMALGFLASTMHLGNPLRAINALNQVGHSWLSNEILTGSAFFAIGGFYWLLEVIDTGPKSLRKGLLALGMLIGVAFMFSMIKVYLIDTVPTWNTIYTPLMFVLTTIISGLIFGHLLLSGASHKMVALDNALPIIGGIAVSVCVIATMSQMISLHDINTAVTSAIDLIPNLMQLQILRISLLLLAAGIWIMPRLINTRPRVPVMLLSFAFVITSELISRGMFFGLHMSVGM